MNAYDEIYRPTAELARYHLRNAITHLLQQQPVQGKAALERLEREVSSLYFRSESEEAVQYFQHGPLSRPRKALVRNFVVVLIKALLEGNLDDANMRRRAAALNAVRDMHRSITEDTFSQKLSDIVRNTDDAHFANVVKFLSMVLDIWQFLAVDVQRKVENYVDNIDVKSHPLIFICFLDYIINPRNWTAC